MTLLPQFWPAGAKLYQVRRLCCQHPASRVGQTILSFLVDNNAMLQCGGWGARRAELSVPPEGATSPLAAQNSVDSIPSGRLEWLIPTRRGPISGCGFEQFGSPKKLRRNESNLRSACG